MFKDTNVWDTYFLSCYSFFNESSSNWLSLFSVGFPSDNYSGPLILPHPWSHSVLITCRYLCSLCFEALCRKTMCKPGPTSSLLSLTKWVCKVHKPNFRAKWQRLVCIAEIPPVYRTDSSAQLTLDQYAILALSPEGWSHNPQNAT